MAMCRPISPIRTRSGGASGPRRPRDLEVGAVAVLADDPADRSSASPTGVAWSAPAGAEPDEDPSPGPRRRAPRGRARRPCRRRWPRGSAAPSAPAFEPADPGREGLDDGLLRREDVGVVPLGRDEDRDAPADTGRSCRRTRRPRPRSPARPRSAPRPASARRWTAGREAPTNPDGSRPAPARRCEDPARCRRLAVRAGDADEPPVAGGRGVGDDLLDALGHDPDVAGGHQLGMVRFDRGDRLGDREPVHDRDARRRRGRAPRRGATRCRSRRRARRRSAGRGRPRRRRSPRAPTAAAWSAAPDDGGATDAEHVDPRPRRDRARPVRAAARPREMSAEVRVIDRRPAAAAVACVARSIRNSRAAAALASMLAARSPSHWKRRTSGPAAIGHRDVHEPDRLVGRARRRVRPRRSRRRRGPRPSRSRTPAAIASATWALTAPWAASTSVGTPSSDRLDVVRVAHDAADEVAGRPGPRRDGVGDEPARARLGRRDGQAGRQAGVLEPLREVRRAARPVSPSGLSAGRCAPARLAARRATSPGSRRPTCARGRCR